jgi:hypothetical protein
MRLALLRQGLFLWPRRRLRPRQTILGVPDFERHGVAAIPHSQTDHGQPGALIPDRPGRGLYVIGRIGSPDWVIAAAPRLASPARPAPTLASRLKSRLNLPPLFRDYNPPAGTWVKRPSGSETSAVCCKQRRDLYGCF